MLLLGSAAGEGHGQTSVRKLPQLSLIRVIALLAVVAVGYFLFRAAGDTLLSRRLNRDEQHVQQEIADLKQQQAQLGAIRDYLKTDAYVEGVARRVLGLVRPGESLVIVSSSVAPTPAPTAGPNQAAPGPWWEQLYGR